jgi:hypothetical protein
MGAERSSQNACDNPLNLRKKDPITEGYSKTRPYISFVSPEISTIHLQLTDKFAPPHTLILKHASSGCMAEPLPADY